MAIQFNDITRIGDAFEMHANTPILGIQSIAGYTDNVLNETSERYFIREFSYSLNGITYSDWIDLTNDNLIEVFVGNVNIFDIRYRYTRGGTDDTGFLTFISIQIVGEIEEVEVPKIFTDLYFNKFFDYNDDSVLRWALNVLSKLYERGVVPNYLTRQEDGIDDEDYLSLLGALTHFMAIIVRYAREFQNFTLNDLLLTEYLRQKNIFVSDGMSLSDLQHILSTIYLNYSERGTNKIVEAADGEDRLVDGELLRLIRKGEHDEFIWGLLEPEKTIWNIGNNSPMYKGTKGAVNLIKAYESTQDFEDLSNYPLINSGFISLYEDGDKQVMRILDVDALGGCGIGNALTEDRLITIDSRLSYEITFFARQAILSNSLSLMVYLYDSDQNLLNDTPLNAVTGVQTNDAIDNAQLLQDGIYYAIRVILFNENISTDASFVPDIGFGNHLILNNSDAKYMSVELVTEIADANNDLRIWDFKVRPLISNIANGFVMVPNIITAYMDNKSEETNLKVQSNIKRYLIPYNCILKNQFLDELFVPSGTPLTIVVLHEDETILGAENGSITLAAVGGTAPYQYSIDNGANFQASGLFTGLASGTYNILVRDAEGVDVTDTVLIGQGINSLTFQTVLVLATKSNVSDGIINVFPSQGLPPYYYSLDGVSFQVSNQFTGLGIGNYTVYVRDTTGFTVSQTVEMTSTRNVEYVVRAREVHGTNLVFIEGVNVNISELSENYTTDVGGWIYGIWLQSGSYSLTFTKSTHRTEQKTISIPNPGPGVQYMYKLYNITFNITETGNGGVTNALIQTTSTPSTQDAFSISTPSGSGSVVKTGIIRGSYTVTVSKSGWETVSESFSVADANLIVNISIDQAERRLNIRLFGVSSYNGPNLLLGNRTVQKYSPAPTVNESTGNTGIAQFDLIAGLYWFRGVASGYSGFARQLQVQSTETTEDLQMYREYVLTINVYQYGAGVIGGWIVHVSDLDAPSPGGIGITDSNGSTSFTLMTGTYRIDVTHPNGPTSGYETRNITLNSNLTEVFTFHDFSFEP